MLNVPAVPPGAAGSPEHAVTNAILLAVAFGWGLSLLFQRGRLTWPPMALLSSLSTLAGCLALVGPLILARSGGKEGSLGELAWMTGGLLIWLFDLAAAFQGASRGLNWTTPLGDRTMGLTMLAVLLAGWRCGLAERRLVLDQCRGLDAGNLLGWHGFRIVAADPAVEPPESGLALILDGFCYTD